MVVDIGKYITDVSVLSANSFETGRMHFYGGAKMDESITTFISDNHGLLVSDETSEAVKNEIASLYDHDTYRTYYIGIDENDKFVKHVISANEVKVAIYNIYEKIVQLIQGVMNNLPKEISKNVHKNGVVFVGGASSISGLFEFMSKKLDCPVIVPDDPSSSVVLGLGKLLNEKDYIKIEI